MSDPEDKPGDDSGFPHFGSATNQASRQGGDHADGGSQRGQRVHKTTTYGDLFRGDPELLKDFCQDVSIVSNTCIYTHWVGEINFQALLINLISEFVN